MNTENKILEVISNETKDSIGQMSVVTPSIYASVFSKFATSHDVEIEDEDELAQDLLKIQCSTLTQMQTQTSQNVQSLSENTQKALTAIKDKDETSLNRVLQETEALRAEIDKLKESIYRDELTNVYNRKWLNDHYVNSEDATFIEAGTLAMIDLNYFKIVNDTHGHIIGDKVLIFIANQLKKSKSEVVRYGGDEFLIMFPASIDKQRAFEILDEIREAVLAKKLKAHNVMFRTSFSIGVYSYKSNDKLNEAIENADKDMYTDKLKIKKRIKGIEV
jgi:diguanylate cyclase (GGDEF)-like protein